LKILVIGESCHDIFIYGSANRLCPEAPVPVFNPISIIKNGGMAKNVYKNLLSLNIEANLFTNENYSSITKTRYIDYNMNYMFLRVDENDDQYGRANLKRLRYKNYDAVIISDYDKGFLTQEDIQHISKKHCNVFLDTKKILGSWCNDIKYIKINKSEYERTKHTVSKEILDKLIITMGSEGCKHQDIFYPVTKVEIKDPVGAGDTFISGLVAQFVKSNNIEEAICFANQCATSVVQKRGTSII